MNALPKKGVIDENGGGPGAIVIRQVAFGSILQTPVGRLKAP
jgi:hypothetical protein